MTASPGLDENIASLLTDDFFEKCGVRSMSLRERDVIGEIDAILMLSNYRDVDVAEIDDADEGVRFMQGKSLKTLRKSIRQNIASPKLSLILSSGSQTSLFPSDASFCSSNVSNFASPPSATIYSDSEIEQDDDTFIVLDEKEPDEADEEKLLFGDDEYETDIEQDFELPQLGDQPSETQTMTYTETYSLFDDDETYTNVGGQSHYIAYGYMSETQSDTEDHQVFDASRELLPSLTKTASDGYPQQSLRSRLDQMGPVPIRRLPPIRRTRPPLQQEPPPFRSTHQTGSPTTTTASGNLVKSRSAHVGLVTDEQLYSAIRPSPPLPMPAFEPSTRARGQSGQSMMSSTSYLLYDVEDTPPPPSCNIRPELIVQANRRRIREG